MRQQDRMKNSSDRMSFGFSLGQTDALSFGLCAKGSFILTLTDGKTGKVLHEHEQHNLIVKDAGIVAARLFANSLAPNPSKNNGLTMLAVGTGATGALLAPDAPSDGQRRLNTEIGRKAFSSVTFRDAVGTAVARPTHVVDFTATFGEADAVGPLNEMCLVSARSIDPTVKAPIMNGPNDYDPTIDVSAFDQIVNYATFAVISKPAGAVLTVTWRITF